MTAATAQIPADHDLVSIITAAGGNASACIYSNGTLTVPNVSQAALDAAVAAYNPTKTALAQQEALATAAVQAWLDQTARSLQYNDIASAVSYAGSSVDLWKRQALAFISWRDSVWQALFTLQQGVVAGTATTPATAAALISSLPQPNIPTT